LTLELGQVSHELADGRGELNDLDNLLAERQSQLSHCEEAIEMLKVFVVDYPVRGQTFNYKLVMLKSINYTASWTFTLKLRLQLLVN